MLPKALKQDFVSLSQLSFNCIPKMLIYSLFLISEKNGSKSEG